MQVEIIDCPLMNDQYCSISQTKNTLNLQVGDQVRIETEDSHIAVYTVKWLTSGSLFTVKLNGKKRLKLTSEAQKGYLKGPCVISYNLTEKEAKLKGEFIEFVIDDDVNTDLICIAAHGGHIDLKTDLQAERVYQSIVNTTLWMCKGFSNGGGAFQRWHTTSNDISPNSFPGLKQLAQRKYSRCISFHGMAEGGILIGGAASEEVKLRLKHCLESLILDENVSIRLSTWSDCCNGLSSRNVCNWLTKDGCGGVQLEQDKYVRSKYWKEVADAVINWTKLVPDKNNFEILFGED